MNKTPEEMAEEYSKVNTSFVGGALGSYRQGLFEGFLAGYHTAYNIAYELGFEDALKARKTFTYIQAEIKKNNENT